MTAALEALLWASGPSSREWSPRSGPDSQRAPRRSRPWVRGSSREPAPGTRARPVERAPGIFDDEAQVGPHHRCSAQALPVRIPGLGTGCR